MFSQFQKDLFLAKGAERIVMNTLKSLTDDYIFTDVSYNANYYHKGDIKAVNKHTGAEYYIEVKDDSRIAETGNILCEYAVMRWDTLKPYNGNMFHDYDIYCIVSKSDKKIYIIDFNILERIYTKGKDIKIYHEIENSTTYCRLLPLKTLIDEGGLLYTIEYTDN